MKSKLIGNSIAISALTIFCAISTSQAATIIISESFGGLLANNLNGTTADTFASGITSSGGSSTWLARGTDFRANGALIGNDTGNPRGGSASLDLGTYINSSKGTASGKFELKATISTTAPAWLSLGFATQNAPNVNSNFTNAPDENGTLDTTGIANMVVRSNGDIDQWAGTLANNPIAANDTIIGNLNQTITIALDFTPAFYNGTTTFGTVIFNVAGVGGYTTTAHTFTANPQIGSLLLSWAGNGAANAAGSYANVTLTQIPEPGSALLGGLGLLALLRRRR